MMTPKEASKTLGEFDFEKISISGNARNVAEFFEACNMGAEALEKQTPNKSDHGCCPRCQTSHTFITDNLAHPKWHPTVYCWNCGQAIDWSEE